MYNAHDAIGFELNNEDLDVLENAFLSEATWDDDADVFGEEADDENEFDWGAWDDAEEFN